MAEATSTQSHSSVLPWSISVWLLQHYIIVFLNIAVTVLHSCPLDNNNQIESRQTIGCKGWAALIKSNGKLIVLFIILGQNVSLLVDLLFFFLLFFCCICLFSLVLFITIHFYGTLLNICFGFHVFVAAPLAQMEIFQMSCAWFYTHFLNIQSGIWYFWKLWEWEALRVRGVFNFIMLLDAI